MRLKSMNKTNSITLSRKNTQQQQQQQTANQSEQDYEINSGESGFDLNMDSGDDEIDVGTNADSMLMNFSNNSNTSEGSYKNGANTSAAAGVQNDHQFGSSDSGNNFAMPQSTSSMSEADRKRAHHNALERKRRDHIKDSFHTLRDAIPNIKGEKVSVSTSRAQILKAATDYIKAMKSRNSVFQNDIDLLKKQNNEIENQIRQLEKAKMSASECLRQQAPGTQSYQIKNELDLSEVTSNYTDNDFKFDLNETTHHQQQQQQTKNNNVLVMTKQQSTLLGTTPTTSKKFKTIVNTKNNVMNNGNYF